MSAEDKASVALRLIIRAVIGATPGDPKSLRNVITNIFPDGALCFVLENRALYELNKESTASPDNLTIIKPIAGPGRWLLVVGGTGGASSLATIVGTTTNGVTTSGRPDFVAIDDTNFDWQPTGAPAGFALDVTGGVITYNGTATVRARAIFTGSLEVSSESGGTTWGAIAHNGDAIDADPTTSFLIGTQTTETGATGLPQIIAAQRTLVLAPGDTVQVVLATDTAENLTLDRMTLSIELA